MKELLLTNLENSRAYTLAVAETMPEALYTSKLTDSGWNFMELMSHIAYGIIWWKDNFVENAKSEWNPSAVSRSKMESIQMLNQCYDSLKVSIQRVVITDQVVVGFYATIDHITHHRGQAVLHLRAQNVSPPEYIF